MAAALVLAVTVGGGVAVQAARQDSRSGTSADPAGVSGGAHVVGADDAPVTVTVYEDFLCPACRQAEQALAPTLDDLVDDGAIRLAYRPIAILDGGSTDEYSTRALNAAACVLDSAPAAFEGFHAALFDAQPPEGGPGLPDSRLAALAAEAGAPGQEACIDERRFEGWTRRVTEQASRDGVHATPTILVDGRPLAERSPQGLRAAVEDARS